MTNRRVRPRFFTYSILFNILILHNTYTVCIYWKFCNYSTNYYFSKLVYLPTFYEKMSAFYSIFFFFLRNLYSTTNFFFFLNAFGPKRFLSLFMRRAPYNNNENNSSGGPNGWKPLLYKPLNVSQRR